MFGIDPQGMVQYKGQMVPTILCHRDSHLLGLGNNHGDIYNWFPRYELDMTTARDDVAALMGEAPVRRILRKGMEGDDVRELQQNLIDRGYDLGKWGADGDFGSATENAVKAFQRDNDLVADGIVGEKTWAKLDEGRVKTYTIVIHGVAQEEMEAMKKRWPECEVKAE